MIDSSDLISSNSTATNPAKPSLLVCLNQRRYEVHDDGSISYQVRQILHLPVENGSGPLEEIALPYAPTHQTVEIDYFYKYALRDFSLDEIRSLAAGNPITGPRSGITPSAQTTGNSLAISLPEQQGGCLLDFQVTVTQRKPFCPGHFWDVCTVQRLAPVILASYTVKVPCGRPLICACYRMTASPSFHKGRENGQDVYTWEISHVPALPVGQKAVDLCDAASSIHVSSFGSWNELAGWYSGVFGERARPEPVIEAQAKSLLRQEQTREEKIAALHAFTATRIRYGQVAGRQRPGYEPLGAAATLANGKGDCKDLAVLLISLLKTAGIQSYPVLINAASETRIDTQFPSPTQFNHVLVAVAGGGGEYFCLDPGVVPFSRIPADGMARDGFMVRESGGDVIPVRDRFMLATPSEQLPSMGSGVAVAQHPETERR